MDISRIFLENKRFFDGKLAKIHYPILTDANIAKIIDPSVTDEELKSDFPFIDFSHFFVTYLNIILVVKGVRKAYLPATSFSGQMSQICDLFAKELPGYVKKLSIPALAPRDLHLIVRADSEHPAPTSDIELGKILGYPCADDWDTWIESQKTDMHIQRTGFDISALTMTGVSVQLFAFFCIPKGLGSTAHISNSLLIFASVTHALQDDPFTKTYIHSIALFNTNSPVPNEPYIAFWINDKWPQRVPTPGQQEGGYRKRSRKGNNRKTRRRRRS